MYELKKKSIEMVILNGFFFKNVFVAEDLLVVADVVDFD